MASLPPIANNPDIRFLGAILGDVIRGYAGEAFLGERAGAGTAGRKLGRERLERGTHGPPQTGSK